MGPRLGYAQRGQYEEDGSKAGGDDLVYLCIAVKAWESGESRNPAGQLVGGHRGSHADELLPSLQLTTNSDEGNGM